VNTTRVLLRTNGERVELDGPVSFKDIERMIDATALTFVTLADRLHVMAMDDFGYETVPVESRLPDGTPFIEMKCIRPRKPVNAEATRLYHEVCIPGTTHQIVGDVVIVPDSDYAGKK